MKIYINDKFEIKAINSSTDKMLTEIEVDRNFVFGNKTDFVILNYCYEPLENGHRTYPRIDYDTLLFVEEYHNKISILNEQNSKLLLDKAKNEIQINTLNKNLANVTLEVAKMKGGM